MALNGISTLATKELRQKAKLDLAAGPGPHTHVFMCSRDLQYQQFDLWPTDFDKYQDLWLGKVEEYYNGVR